MRAQAGVLIFTLLVAATLIAQSTLNPHEQLARDIFRELIEINTTDSVGDNTRAADAMASRLRAAGFPSEDVRILAPAPRKGNVVARLRGAGRGKPLLLLAHLDVVEARREDWTVDPFTFTEKDGYFYGRGTSDDKYMAAIFVANLIRLRQEGFRPARDIIVALTADEEGGDHNGVTWLLQNHRDLIDAEFCINEGGDGVSKEGRRVYQDVQAAEKVYQSFRLESKNPGGHSSLPSKDNAIYHLAGALVRLSQFDFPVQLNEVTRRFFERTAALETGETARDMRAVAAQPPDLPAAARLSAALPFYNAQLRTTCVATLLDGGHAENALPQTARATVNCRMLPGSDPAEVQKTLQEVIADPKVSIAPVAQSRPSAPSPLRPNVVIPIEQITEQMWPGVVAIPTMATGATDGLTLRNAGIPTYGVSGVFFDINDNTSHGRDERLGVSDFFAGLEFQYRLAKALSALPETR